MPVYSIIPKSMLEGAHRLDAEYYQPEYLENDEVIKNYRNGFKLLIVEANEALKKSELLYSQAEDLLLRELGLKDFKPQDNLARVVNLSDVKSAHRIDGEYLALCINSIVCQMQIERDSGGSIIAHWKPEQIKNLLIPILPKPIQQKIADLVRRSHEARRKAKELLEEAKQKVAVLLLEGKQWAIPVIQ